MYKSIAHTMRITLTALIISVVAACAPTSETPQQKAAESTSPAIIIYLVRHAEKITGPDAGRDPELNEAGKARAQELAKVLADKNITSIYSTDYIRTRDTASPLASALGLEVTLYNPRTLDEFAEQLKKQKGTLLVVGHSNTTPYLTAKLGGDAGTPIDEPSEYDRLYEVHITDDGVTSTLTRYGEKYHAENE
jgi:broad specificity phosphatase PhoE